MTRTFEQSLNDFFKDSDNDTNFMFVGMLGKTSLEPKQKRELIDAVVSKRKFSLVQNYSESQVKQVEDILKFIIRGAI